MGDTGVRRCGGMIVDPMIADFLRGSGFPVGAGCPPVNDVSRLTGYTLDFPFGMGSRAVLASIIYGYGGWPLQRV